MLPPLGCSYCNDMKLLVPGFDSPIVDWANFLTTSGFQEQHDSHFPSISVSVQRRIITHDCIPACKHVRQTVSLLTLTLMLRVPMSNHTDGVQSLPCSGDHTNRAKALAQDRRPAPQPAAHACPGSADGLQAAGLKPKVACA